MLNFEGQAEGVTSDEFIDEILAKLRYLNFEEIYYAYRKSSS
jgi:hypothetical protein